MKSAVAWLESERRWTRDAKVFESHRQVTDFTDGHRQVTDYKRKLFSFLLESLKSTSFLYNVFFKFGAAVDSGFGDF